MQKTHPSPWKGRLAVSLRQIADLLLFPFLCTGWPLPAQTSGQAQFPADPKTAQLTGPFLLSAALLEGEPEGASSPIEAQVPESTLDTRQEAVLTRGQTGEPQTTIGES